VVSELLRGGALRAAFEVDATATVELLWARGDYAVAWGMTVASAETLNTAQVASDLAMRLDMLCDQRTILPDLRGRWGREAVFYFP